MARLYHPTFSLLHSSEMSSVAYENVNGDQSDMSYRYKMPVIQIKNEGRGNGVKTVIPNIEPVALAIRRRPARLLNSHFLISHA